MQVEIQPHEEGFLSDNGSEEFFEVDDVYGNQNHTSFEGTVEEAKRRNYSLNGLHAVMNKMFVDMKKTERSDYVSYDKLRRAWIRIGGELEEEHDQLGQFEFLGFDGKKSDLLCEHNR